MSTNAEKPNTSTRIDRWLWCARWFKTRTLAVNAIDNGRVLLNGVRPKPSKPVHIGDTLQIRRPPYTWEISVTGISEKRVSAKIAAELYQETVASLEQREQLQQKLSLQVIIDTPRSGKLNKKERREREKFKRTHEQT